MPRRYPAARLGEDLHLRLEGQWKATREELGRRLLARWTIDIAVVCPHVVSLVRRRTVTGHRAELGAQRRAAQPQNLRRRGLIAFRFVHDRSHQ